MAAPIAGQPDTDILARLENLLDDNPPPPKEPENRQPTKEEITVTTPESDEDTPDEDTPVVEDEPEEPGIAAAKKETVEASEEAEGDDSIHTITDLAKMFEVEEKELLEHLEVDLGEGKSASLSQVVDTYKNAPELTQGLEEMRRDRAAFQVEAAQLRERTDNSIRDLAQNAQALLDVTTEDFKDVNWKQLEVEDPQAYLILKDKQKERTQLITNAIEKLKGEEAKRAADFHANSAKTRESEVASLHKKMPDWSDPEKAQAAMTETQQFLASSDFTVDEINGISDHRHLLVAWQAAQWVKLQKNAPKKLAKLRGLPKPKSVLRSGARREASGDARKQAQKNFDRLKKTGSERDAARLMEELL